jgi:Ca-activated chloride channel homolog
MPPRNKIVPLILFLIALWAVALAAQTQAPAAQQQAPAQQPAQAQPPAPPANQTSAADEELRPEELVVPTNAAAAAAAATAPVLAPVESTPTPSTTTATAPAPSQPGNTQPPGSTPEIRSTGKTFSITKNVEEVVLHATVVDERQRLVTNLNKTAFTVLEDGQPREITSFRHEDVPVAVGILVDNSGSMRDKRSAVNTAALNFVQASNPQDQVFIVNFDTDAYLDSDFTSSIPQLREALQKVESKGGTALYDAVFAASNHLEKKAKLEKRVLLVVTDGWDNASTMSLEQAVQAVQTENGPTIYTIGILDEEGRKKGKRALKELAEQTGGVAFFPRDLTEVDSITRAVARDIRNQYIIGYKKDPTKAPGYRTVKVLARADGYKNLQVRTRSGYFPGQETAQK